jgi:hypothetical protein
VGTVTGNQLSQLPYKPVFEDPDAVHQVVLRLAKGRKSITLGCTCMRGHQVIDAKTLWLPGEAVTRWREHEREATSDGR